MYDTRTSATTRVTYGSDSSRASDHASLSADGSTLVFQSDSEFNGDSIPDNQFEIWLYDTATMSFTRITTGSETNRDSLRPGFSADGSDLAFHSDSDFNGGGIPDNQNEVWFSRLRYTIFLPLVSK